MERMGLSSARSSRPHSGRSSPQDEPPGYSRNRGGRYDSAEQFPQRTYTSDRSVDPSRRAKHQSRTIDDWTSSKHDDSGARRLTSESSSELHVPGDTASRKSTRYEDFDDMQDDDDVPVFGRDQTRQDAWDSSGKSSILPLTIPYTTPASEFLYGTSVVTAALKSNRRKLYKLYMYNGENREVANQDEAMRKLALAAGVEIVQVGRDWMRLMDKMSAGRPHNGYVLEASPLPRLPITGLLPVERKRGPLRVVLDHQTLEDEAINGKDPEVKYKTQFPRYPFLLMLDNILDPGNLGGILRSAFFLGVDAVAVSDRNSAPLSPIALKASAGASESLPLFSVRHPAAFVEESQKNGWKFYAAVAPSAPKKSSSSSSSANPRGVHHFSTSDVELQERDHPTVLMLGGEGEGLRWNLQKKADFTVSIGGPRKGEGGVDSLNVSVAAGLLCETFLRKPSSTYNILATTKTPEEVKPERGERDLF